VTTGATTVVRAERADHDQTAPDQTARDQED
jgi:hypothetical protein